jgi:hypothetical protein
VTGVSGAAAQLQRAHPLAPNADELRLQLHMAVYVSCMHPSQFRAGDLPAIVGRARVGGVPHYDLVALRVQVRTRCVFCIVCT